METPEKAKPASGSDGKRASEKNKRGSLITSKDTPDPEAEQAPDLTGLVLADLRADRRIARGIVLSLDTIGLALAAGVISPATAIDLHDGLPEMVSKTDPFITDFCSLIEEKRNGGRP